MKPIARIILTCALLMGGLTGPLTPAAQAQVGTCA